MARRHQPINGPSLSQGANILSRPTDCTVEPWTDTPGPWPEIGRKLIPCWWWIPAKLWMLPPVSTSPTSTTCTGLGSFLVVIRSNIFPTASRRSGVRLHITSSRYKAPSIGIPCGPEIRTYRPIVCRGITSKSNPRSRPPGFG